MGWRQLSATALLSVTLWAGAYAAPTSSVEMLREMFQRPVTEWQQTLRTNSRLLNEEFFTNIGKRVRWGVENNHVDDAFRFAMVGDFAAEATRRPANYRIDLATLFFKAQNYVMAGQIVDNIRITSPTTPAASEAQFLSAQIKEMQKDLFGAYTDFIDLAQKKYKPDETWYRAGLISLFMGEETRALEEFKKSGSPEAMARAQGIEAQRSDNWDAIAPVPNSENDVVMPDTSGISYTPPSSSSPEFPDLNPSVPGTSSAVASAPQADPLARARVAVADNRLVDALDLYENLFNPGDLQVSLEYGAVLYRLGDLKEAKSVYDQALSKNGKSVELLRGRANTLERLFDREGQRDNLNAAVADYQQATALAPDHQLLPWELARAKSKN